MGFDNARPGQVLVDKCQGVRHESLDVNFIFRSVAEVVRLRNLEVGREDLPELKEGDAVELIYFGAVLINIGSNIPDDFLGPCCSTLWRSHDPEIIRVDDKIISKKV